MPFKFPRSIFVAAFVYGVACSGTPSGEAEPENDSGGAGGESAAMVGAGGETFSAGGAAGDAVQAGTAGSSAGGSNVAGASGGMAGAMSAGGAGSMGGAGGIAPQGPGVPIVVALGDGGFTMASCDLGRSWKVNMQFSGVRGDHTEWTTFGGMAFGNGMFVGATGWGAPGHMISSANGVGFTEIPDSAFTRNNQAVGLNDSIGGIAFDGTSFVAFSRYVLTSTDGIAWSARDNSWPRGVQQLRQLRGFPSKGLLVASVETQNGGDHPLGNWVVVSNNNGKTWTEGTGFRGSCANPIQHTGDIELVGDTLVVGASDVCRSTDLGKTWEFVGAPSGGQVGDVFADQTAFYIVGGDRLMRSTDGKTWQVFGQKLPEAVHRGVFANGRYVVMNARATKVFSSVDGLAWQAVSPAGVGGNQQIRDLIVGRGLPSAMCAVP